MGLSKPQKDKLEKSRAVVSKRIASDGKVAERDLYDRLLKQVRMPDAYEETQSSAAAMHLRPPITEAPGGFTQMPEPLKKMAAQCEYYHTFSGLFPEIRRAWMTIDHMLFLWDYTDPRGSFYQARGP